MRVKHTLLNISAGLGSQILITALSFVTRTVFIHSLGIEYLGINGLFTSLLAMLSLAEAGIGSSIIYSLYKPVAEQDQRKIMGLMRLYRNAYRIIAMVVFTIGLILLPFLHFFVKDTTIPNITLIYMLFLLNTAVPYFFVYKQSFLNVNQKNYVITLIFTVSSILSTCTKVLIILYTQNYILYLLIESIFTMITSVLLAKIVDRVYPFLKNKAVIKIDSQTKKEIIKNIKAIVLQNIGNYFIFGIESILISTFISLAAVGLYSNYKMLLDICRTFINQIFKNMYHSIGNLIAKESKDKVFSIFKVTMLVNFWLYSLMAILLYLIVEPFITIWIGSQFLMGSTILFILVITFYERGMRNSITTVKTTSGIFHADRFAPLCQAVINLLVSIILVKKLGFVGIFIGTLVSSIVIPFWLTPYLVYRDVFRKPLWMYYAQYLFYLGVGLAAYLLAWMTCSVFPADTFLLLIVRAMVCVTTVNLVYIVIFHRTAEFKYLLFIAKNILSKFTLNRF